MLRYTKPLKMLYDDSQLARVYLHAWQVTGYEVFRTIVEEPLDYVMREMLGSQASPLPGGGGREGGRPVPS
jgi:hypothetical protein